MDSAYDKWAKGMSMEDFYFSLPVIERKAIVLGNFNYQVENGGFSQWNINRYMSLHISELKQILMEMNTIISVSVLELVKQYEGETEDEGDDLDSEYYKINEEFMQEVEAYLKQKQMEVHTH